MIVQLSVGFNDSLLNLPLQRCDERSLPLISHSLSVSKCNTRKARLTHKRDRVSYRSGVAINVEVLLHQLLDTLYLDGFMSMWDF